MSHEAGWALCRWHARPERILAQGLIALALSGLGWSAAFAAPAPAAALQAGRAALDDGFYEIALSNLAVAAAQAGDRGSRAEAALLTAQALAGLQRFPAALELLRQKQNLADTPARECDFDYWITRVLYDSGAWPEALRAAEAHVRRFPESVYLPLVQRLRGRCLIQLKEPEEALRVFAALAKDYAFLPELAADNLRDWAALLVQMNHPDEAREKLLRLLADYPHSAAAEPARLWLAKLWIEDREWERADAALRELARRETARPENRAEAWFELARLAEAQTNWNGATQALAQAAAVAPDSVTRARALAARGLIMVRGGDLTNGPAAVREALAALPPGPEAGALQLDLAQRLLDQRSFEQAAAEFQHYLDAFTNQEGQAAAQLGRGWSLWELTQYAESAAAFQRAATLAAAPEDQRTAAYKAAEALFADQQYRAAREAYLQLARDFPDGDHSAEARFQAAECRARLGDAAGAAQDFDTLIRAETNTVPASRALLRMAQLYEEQEAWDQAVELYGRVISLFPGTPHAARAMQARGLVRYRLGQFNVALDDFNRVVEQFPNDPLNEQAFYMRGWCLYLLGQDVQALEIGQAFIARYPQSTWTPDVLFWLGEYEFNHGRYQDSERRFAQLAEAYPRATLADASLYWAGRSAMALKEYQRAIDYLNRLARDYPQSTRIAEVRFAQGDALSELGQFATAILAFEEITAKYPESYLADLAWGRKGDCQFTLGSDNPKRYADALQAYRRVRESMSAGRELKLQAEYKMGRCLEKMGETREAFEHYMSVVYDYTAGLQKGESAGELWFMRAAFSAAGIQEAAGNWRAAVNIYRRVTDAGGSAAEEARQRARAIRLEHWILF